MSFLRQPATPPRASLERTAAGWARTPYQPCCATPPSCPEAIWPRGLRPRCGSCCSAPSRPCTCRVRAGRCCQCAEVPGSRQAPPMRPPKAKSAPTIWRIRNGLCIRMSGPFAKTGGYICQRQHLYLLVGENHRNQDIYGESLLNNTLSATFAGARPQPGRRRGVARFGRGAPQPRKNRCVAAEPGPPLSHERDLSPGAGVVQQT